MGPGLLDAGYRLDRVHDNTNVYHLPVHTLRSVAEVRQTEAATALEKRLHDAHALAGKLGVPDVSPERLLQTAPNFLMHLEATEDLLTLNRLSAEYYLCRDIFDCASQLLAVNKITDADPASATIEISGEMLRRLQEPVAATIAREFAAVIPCRSNELYGRARFKDLKTLLDERPLT